MIMLGVLAFIIGFGILDDIRREADARRFRERRDRR